MAVEEDVFRERIVTMADSQLTSWQNKLPIDQRNQLMIELDKIDGAEMKILLDKAVDL